MIFSIEEEVMPRTPYGQIISARRKIPEEVQKVRALQAEAKSANDLDVWRRCQAVLDYIKGIGVSAISEQLDAARSSVQLWLHWYEDLGADGLRTRKAPGAAPKLTEEQRAELTRVIEAGPQAAGFSTGLWTGPMVGIHGVWRTGWLVAEP